MSEEKPVLGGMGEPREPTEEDQAILDKVKEQYEKQSGTNPGEFKAILVDTGEDTYIHVRVFVPLPGSDEGPTLVSFQANKTKDDKLEYFEAKDEDQLVITHSKNATSHPSWNSFK
ncbi:leukocyte cysteine proteinase inhibitor 1-like [Aquarana catesbeiana]|uniref:leukocyte cysteine proteinase inhibitor 1-like n=1 Tax=Aquarana catesbeiana TaxID=8400 RepID=UPI003CC9E7ED